MTNHPDLTNLRLRVRWDAGACRFVWADGGEPLTFDECEALELDGTSRLMASWGAE